MVRINSLKNLISNIGDIVDMRYSGSVTWTTGEIVTGQTSGATGYITAINSDSKTLMIIPTSDTFFVAMENIIGSVQTTPVPLLPSEITFFDQAEKAIKTSIESYMNRTFGETKTKTIKTTTENKQRYYKIPHRINSLISVTLNNVLLTENIDFWYNSETGLIDFNKKLVTPTKPNNLIIVYIDGTLTIPDNVKQASSILLVELWKMRNHSDDMRGASSINFGAKTVTFTQPIQSSEIEALLPMVKHLILRGSRWNFME